MQPSLEKLRKFFRLEHENKYQNTAIIGGLAKMLDYWEGEARADGITEEVIQAVVARLRSYEKLSPEGRAESLKGLWKRIAETYPEAGQKPKSQAPAVPYGAKRCQWAGNCRGGRSRSTAGSKPAASASSIAKTETSPAAF
ncbi:MAG: hypothetical protein HND47_22765 [Chloroflexi bacterium]|nr:hypothetical protein [Chloroflexota bacterium]